MILSYRFAVALLVAVLLLTPVASPAQYTVKCTYLIDPGLAIGYVDSCAKLWAKVYDPTYGGFYTNVDRQGNVLTSWGTNKHIISETRDAYGFTRAFMLTGDESYLTQARRALDFQYAHAWDNTNGGWFGDINRDGSPINPGGTKIAFNQHYALLGPAAYFEATRDTTDWNWLMRGYAHNESIWWDAAPGREGYYDTTNSNGTNQRAKSFNSTVDAITTHILPLYLLTESEPYRTRLIQLAANMRDRLLPTVDSCKVGFVEMYYTDWSWSNSMGTDQYRNRTIMGHVLKTAWCFGRIQQLLPDPTYLPAAEKLAANVWAKGYDHTNGGPYKDYDRTNGSMFFYGQDSAKAWWQMEQAVTAGLMLYDLTKKPDYLQMADETLQFYMRYFVDHTYGDVYSDVSHDGSAVLWNTAKGSSGKAAYHSIETGYYVYLYGSLFYKGEPATLHYKFAPAATARDIKMNPVAWTSSKYQITQVLQDGNPYLNYTGANRTLHLEPGVGGHFTVTYAPTVTSVAAGDAVPQTFELAQNYPNPFNPETVVSYQLSVVSHVELRVFDLLGREVAVLASETKQPGKYQVRFDGSRLASGVYVYRLTAGTFSAAKKMVLVK